MWQSVPLIELVAKARLVGVSSEALTGSGRLDPTGSPDLGYSPLE